MSAEIPGTCANPACRQDAEVSCLECQRGFCQGHAGHPLHTLPINY
ncbi:MAG: hypothetical protein WCA31_06950 [Acidimicrobiales bacterium]